MRFIHRTKTLTLYELGYALLMCAAYSHPMSAQALPTATKSSLTVAALYTTQRGDYGDGAVARRNGGVVEVGLETPNHWGGVLSTSRTYQASSDGYPNLIFSTLMVGPRYYIVSPSYRLRCFADVLGGVAREGWSGRLTSSSAAFGFGNASAYAFAARVGVDLKVSERIRLRPVQAEWAEYDFPAGLRDVRAMSVNTGVAVRIF